MFTILHMLRLRFYRIHTSEFFLPYYCKVCRGTLIISRSSSQMKLWTYKMADLHFLTLSLVPPSWDDYMPTHTALGFHGWDNVRRGRVKHNRHAAVSSPAVGCN